MASLIIIRLHPDKPISGDSFTNYLQNLQINAYDLSTADPLAADSTKSLLGTAKYLPPLNPFTPWIPNPNTTIVQHFTAIAPQKSEAVATAVIDCYQLPSPYSEYVSPDLRIEVLRNGSLVSDTRFYYDVITVPSPYVVSNTPAVLNPNTFQGYADSEIGVYLKLPPPIASSAAFLNLSDDGAPPNYSALKAAVNAVLSADQQPIPSATIDNLTRNQARHIAYEIVWGTQPPMPLPVQTGLDNLSPLYTNPPNDGDIFKAPEQNRLQFEGNLSAYYAINNAKVDRLTRYVYALSTAIACETFSSKASAGLLQFPIFTGGVSAALGAAEVMLEAGAGKFTVPAEYFYVLGAELSTKLNASQRFSMYCGDSQARMLPLLTEAYDNGIIAPNPSTNPALAVRLISALTQITTTGIAVCDPTTAEAVLLTLSQVQTDWFTFWGITKDWRSYQPGDDATVFWPTEFTKSGYLYLLLCAVTGGFHPLIKAFVDKFYLTLVVKNAQDLAGLSEAQWLRLFQVIAQTNATATTIPPGNILSFVPAALVDVVIGMSVSGNGIANLTVVNNFPAAGQVAILPGLLITLPSGTQIIFTNPALLPPFIPLGDFGTRLAGFLSYVQQFFQMPLGSDAIPPLSVDAPPLLDLPTDDLIAKFAKNYQLPHPGWSFGTIPLVNADVHVAINAISEISTDAAAKAWLFQRIHVLNELCFLAGVTSGSVLPAPNPAFSIAEALYARGFTSAEDIKSLSFPDFATALRGTVAFLHALAIYVKAGGVNITPIPQPPGVFHPVNPGGLVNCIPPCYLSPLGPVEYLHELLKLSEASDCKKPFHPPLSGHKTLGHSVAERRGPLGELDVTAANAETQLPLLDIVNENLEHLVYLVSHQPPKAPVGVVHNTASDHLSGYALRRTDDESTAHGFEPNKLFTALPQHSSPAVFRTGQPGVYDKLKWDFSAPTLPYAQSLDICRTYLEHFGTCRFEAMRAFHKEITEFTLEPALNSSKFQAHLWRYPVRIDIAIEYLGISPEEYELLFVKDIVLTPTPGHLVLYELYGFTNVNPGGVWWVDTVLMLPEFLKRSGLSYCELVELQKSCCFAFCVETATQRDHPAEKCELPDCEPCCLDHYRITFLNPSNQVQALKELVIFLRLWRKLQAVCGARYNFWRLCDICEVLQLFIAGAVNPDFIRQLAAFQILKDQLALKLSEHPSPSGSHGAERTHILALWVGPAAAKWRWAVGELLERTAHFAKRRHDVHHRMPQFIKLLAINLEPLSILAGFNPAIASDTWHARPTNTLRFAEILAKIYASDFSVGEILYLFTANPHLDGDDPFPLPTRNESLEYPLGLPDDDQQHDLWALRKKLLEVEVSEQEVREWNWRRIETTIRDEFGYEPPAGHDYLISLGKHFFPTMLEHSGIAVSAHERQYRVTLSAISTVSAIWNNPTDGPFHYDSVSQQLWTELPLRDQCVVEKLEHLRQLNHSAERHAVQNLYYSPRLDLAPFVCFFPSLADAETHLIEQHDEQERWRWFRHCFAVSYKRCHIIAEHLARHVAAETDCSMEHAKATAWLILQNLFADENTAKTPWEDDSGVMPTLNWRPLPSGGAFAALLGLTGTGLFGEYRLLHAPSPLIWWETRGPMSAFGHVRNEHNAPLPTVLPSMDLQLTADQLTFAQVRNGFAIADKQGTELGGAEGFAVNWSGVLLVEAEGRYEFCAGAPTPFGEEPNLQAAEHSRWLVRLSRGQKSWIILSHCWPDESCLIESVLTLKCGAYDITVQFAQPALHYCGVDDIHKQHSGFQVKYAGPDTDCRMETLPLRRLYRDYKRDERVRFPENSVAGQFLDLLYTSSLRDMRRTYQRAFKAVLFAHRFQLSGRALHHFHQSELGYMLDHGNLFAGVSYYRNSTLFSKHEADFNFNFLPILDPYHSPINDLRAAPKHKREQAMFDWWERIFDYTRMRKDRTRNDERPIWLLFEEAAEKQPGKLAQLLRHLDVDLRHADLLLSYFRGMTHPVYPVTAADLSDDRWAVRVWHSDRWIVELLEHFKPRAISKARPDLWSSTDPGKLVTGEKETGDFNLAHFLDDGCLLNGLPPRYADVKRLNDCLRERARTALLVYLCAMNRVPVPWSGHAKTAKELSALLLLDVETGICEKISRIEEGINAVQNFMRRAGLGLEKHWFISAEFRQLWRHEFEFFHIWEKCKCRTLYKENWIDWDELRKARKIEAFQFLEAELRRSTLSIAVPGGLEYWPETLPPVHPAVKLLQHREPSALRLLKPPREGLGVLGTPERDARPSWLAPDFGEQRWILPHEDHAAFAGFSGKLAVEKLPYWIQAAIKLGVKFIRVAAGGVAPAAAEFHPSDFHQEPGCCNECGCAHPPLVDEYYFWLVATKVFNAVEQDEYYDPILQVSVLWHDPNNLPQLLDWKAASAVRLAWVRVHNGQFMQPQRSVQAVQLLPASTPDLVYIGRVADSLTFSVTNGLTPVGFSGKEAPGFRYDLAADYSVALPLVADPLPQPSTYPAGLPVYPYFVYVEPGDRLFPDSVYAPAVAVAGLLRCHCRFESALKWYRLFLNPLETDNTWVHCSKDKTPPPPRLQDVVGADQVALAVAAGNDDIDYRQPVVLDMCCDSTNISAAVARNRAILMHYLDTLIEWSRALLRRNSRESAQQARLLLDTAAMILGPCPKVIVNHEPHKPQTVASFKPLNPPLNPRLMDLYSSVRDELALVHRCLSPERLRNGGKDCSAPYWGQEPCNCGPVEHHCGCEAVNAPSCDDDGCNHPRSPYRFAVLLQKAQEAAGQVRELGTALLSVFERGDAEYLASMRARHATQLEDMVIKVRQDQWREADWQVKALGKSKLATQDNQRYYQNLINAGLNNGELGYQSNMESAIGLLSSAIPEEITGEALRLNLDTFIGTNGVQLWLPLGSKLGEMFQAMARITNEFAGVASTTASLDLTQGGWQRRLDEWVHQVDVLGIEIEQIEIQILGAERRRNQTLEELNIQQSKLEQSREELNALRDKFTSHELYLYLQKETAAIYWKMYELARHLALEAQQAFNFELGFTKRNFLECEDWDTLHEGLLAGERLLLALKRMDAEYLSCNRREYELTKHISLAQQFPLEFIRLKITGCCEINLPEWLFDMDYPGQYMRRIKSISLTIPCVTGPYTSVNCRMTLLSSRTRIDPRLPCPLTACCDDKPRNPCGCRHEAHEHYQACGNDRRMVSHYGAREAIATSSGRNDSGLFELNFRDERHLPFEFYGALSCWRIEMPPENNYFDLDSLTDVVLHMNYTSREGGEMLRDAAQASVRGKLPGNGWIYLDLRKDFPDAWELFSRNHDRHAAERRVALRISRKLFPFLPDNPTLKIVKLAVLFEMGGCGCENPCPDIHECPCAQRDVKAGHLVEVSVEHADRHCDENSETEICCVGSVDWPNMYFGMGDVNVAPIDHCSDNHCMTLNFSRHSCEITRVFLFCQYEVIAECCETLRPPCGCA